MKYIDAPFSRIRGNHCSECNLPVVYIVHYDRNDPITAICSECGTHHIFIYGRGWHTTENFSDELYVLLAQLLENSYEV